MQKLFVNMGKPCPVQFNVAVPDELGNYNICSRIVYVRPEYQRSTFVHSTRTKPKTSQSTMAVGRATAAAPLIGSLFRCAVRLQFDTKKQTIIEGSEGIQRCPNHQEQERSERPAVDPHTVHVLRCDHGEAFYETADASQQRVHNQVVPVSFIATSAFLLLLLPNPTKALG